MSSRISGWLVILWILLLLILIFENFSWYCVGIAAITLAAEIMTFFYNNQSKEAPIWVSLLGLLSTGSIILLLIQGRFH